MSARVWGCLVSNPEAVVDEVLYAHRDIGWRKHDDPRFPSRCPHPCAQLFRSDTAHRAHVAAAVVDALAPKPEQPENVVRRASALRFAHYLQIGAHPLEWSQLTDAQKLPWLLKSAAWVREPAEEAGQ